MSTHRTIYLLILLSEQILDLFYGLIGNTDDLNALASILILSSARCAYSVCMGHTKLPKIQQRKLYLFQMG